MLNQKFILCFLVLISSFMLDALKYSLSDVTDSSVEMGTGAHWDDATNSLYYVDISAGNILRYSYDENRVYRAKVVREEFPSFIIPVEDRSNLFAVGLGRKVRLVSWDGVSQRAVPLTLVFEVNTRNDIHHDKRFNVGKCDSQGRLFAGTMAYDVDVNEKGYGKLYKYAQRRMSIVKRDVGIASGLAWNDRKGKFYFLDAAGFAVKEYDYNSTTGNVDVASERVILDLQSKAHPNDIAVDTMGNVYVAASDATVYKINPRTGKILLKIPTYCSDATSLAFGGPNLDILYVTTGGCGPVFKVTELCAPGHKMHKFKYF